MARMTGVHPPSVRRGAGGGEYLWRAEDRVSSCGSAAPAVAGARVAVRTDHGWTTPETERWRTGRGGTGGRGERFREGRGCPKPFPLRTDGPGPTHVCVPTAERRYKQEACGAPVVWPCAWTSAYGSVRGHPAGRRHREGPGRAGVPVPDHHTVPSPRAGSPPRGGSCSCSCRK